MSRVYKNILWFGVGAILIFSPIARGAVRTWSITPVLLISYTLTFLWLWKINNIWVKGQGFRLRQGFGGQARVNGTDLDWPITILASLAVISFIFSIYKHDSFYALLKLLGYGGIYYLIVNEFDHTMRKRLIVLVIYIGTGISLYGLLQHFGLLNHSWWVPKDFLAATYVNHNHFAGYLELVMPAAIGALLRYREYRLGLVAALVIMAAAFILTQSRGAWISLSIAGCIAVFVMSKKGMIIKKKGILVLTLIAALIASLAYFGKDIISQRMDTISQLVEGEEASFGIRLKIWRGAIDMLAENPLTGTGIGTFIWGFPPYRPEDLNVQANAAHNDYLQAASEMGMMAPIVIVWLLVIVIRKAIKESSLDEVKFGCGIGILSLSLHGLVDFNFHIPANMLLFTVYAAFIMAKETNLHPRGGGW